MLLIFNKILLKARTCIKWESSNLFAVDIKGR